MNLRSEISFIIETEVVSYLMMIQINESGIYFVRSLWVVLPVVVILLLLSRCYGSLYDFVLLLELLQLKMHHCNNVWINVFSSFVDHRYEIICEFMFDKCA
jgi:hypothetical protein